jgi:exosortase A
MNRSIESASPNWKPTLTAIALILVWIGYSYWDTLEAMAHIWWRAETYTHGLIVPPITLWLIWRKRHRLASFQPQATSWLLLPVAALVVFWLLGELTAVNALTQFAVIGIIILAVMTLVGLPISKELTFPLIFLLFAVPIGDFMMPRLMEWTADFTVLALRATGIPVYREGQSFVIPSGQWSVIEACSGIRYLIASVTVGTLYAYLTYTSLKRRLIFILVSILVPILANWLRAYLIVMLGHLSDNKLAAGVDHLIYGWVFFGIVIAIMFAIGMRWAEPSYPDQPVRHTAPSARQATPSHWLIALILAALIAAGPLADKQLRRANASTPVVLLPPDAAASWQAGPPRIEWKPVFNNASAELHSAYSQSDRWVGLYIAYYRNQDYQRKLVTSTNVLATSLDLYWQVVASGLSTGIIAGSQERIRHSELLKKQGNPDERYIVWQWYWINGRLTSSDIEAKWLTALSMLSGRGDDSAAVVIYAPKSDAEAILSDFANDMAGEIQRALAETRRQ